MTEDAVSRALLRVDVWNLLARAFSRPDAASLASQASLACDLLADDSLRNQLLREAFASFIEEAQHADPLLLEQEYHQLFTTQMLCPPHEGAYQRTSRGAVLGDIAAFYSAFGIRMRETGGAPDGMAQELHFLAWLALKEAYAIQRQRPEDVEVTRNATRTFLSDHVGRWAAAFVERLVNASPSPYYVAAGQLLIAVLNHVTAEFAIRALPPLAAQPLPPEPETIACPAAGICPTART